MLRDLVKIVVFFAVLLMIVLYVAPTPSSPCMTTVGKCSVYTGV